MMNEESDTSRHFLRQWIEKDVADGKTGGKVVTRFPPEPNGYIHIGHAKAVCVDFGMAELFGGECHLRLDDTNPAKESDEYAENIKKDINWLGFQWSGEGDAGEKGFYNASNMFDQMYAIAEELIRRGQAYCCNLTQDEWKEYRGVPEKPGRPSPSRDTDPERNLRIFHEMRDGKYADGEWCLRAKIDMASPNIHFRDPVIYRIRHVAHYHLGDKWCVYPMYDFAHPIEDALEGVTHSMCTLEFEVHRPLYDWVVDRMDEQGLLPVRNGVKIRTQQREFARLNLTYTVMSKRLLLQMVQEKVVDGWDDPRMPTVCGMRRRGYTPGAIREFCDRIGVSKVESESDPALLEWCVREELNQTAMRRIAVVDPVKVVIDNWNGPAREAELPNNPLDGREGGDAEGAVRPRGLDRPRRLHGSAGEEVLPHGAGPGSSPPRCLHLQVHRLRQGRVRQGGRDPRHLGRGVVGRQPRGRPQGEGDHPLGRLRDWREGGVPPLRPAVPREGPSQGGERELPQVPEPRLAPGRLRLRRARACRGEGGRALPVRAHRLLRLRRAARLQPHLLAEGLLQAVVTAEISSPRQAIFWYNSLHKPISQTQRKDKDD